MFKDLNIGNVIRKIADIVFGIGTVVAIVYMLIALGKGVGLLAILLSAVAVLVLFVQAVFLYAVGNIVENTDIMRKKLESLDEKINARPKDEQVQLHAEE